MRKIAYPTLLFRDFRLRDLDYQFTRYQQQQLWVGALLVVFFFLLLLIRLIVPSVSEMLLLSKHSSLKRRINLRSGQSNTMIFSIGVIVVLILSMGMPCFIFMWQKDKKKVTRTSKVVGKVHEIYIYPIKSCAGIKVHFANVTSSGLAYGEYCSDRAWAIVREGTIDTSEKAIAHNVNCTVMTIRQLSKMVLVQPSFSKVNGNLVITVPSSGETAESVEVPIRSSGIEWRCLLWDTPVKGIDQGSRVSNLLTSFLKSKEQLHLVYMGNKNFRYLKCLCHLSKIDY